MVTIAFFLLAAVFIKQSFGLDTIFNKFRQEICFIFAVSGQLTEEELKAARDALYNSGKLHHGNCNWYMFEIG